MRNYQGLPGKANNGETAYSPRFPKWSKPDAHQAGHVGFVAINGLLPSGNKKAFPIISSPRHVKYVA
jgi:hypothetical protein